jgi:hypothetical protein
VDTTTLVSDLIGEGSRIIEQLPRDGFEITAAFWLKRADDGEWCFYIVSPSAQPERLNDAYAQVFTLIRRMPGLHWIDPLEVRLIQPSHPMAKDVLAIHQSAPHL